ncbi:tautomerase family protein [Methyloferula stellata]|uniref:tautomerase family protein n=1 Tax=Methyloferula stellata TaxID=876270 RepID=UPI000375626D|nr:tautomerase family protein [Methyloferula stellata]
MPTYVCFSLAGQLSAEQKHRMAEELTAAHSEEMHAPRYLVQVVFQSLPAGDCFIGGQPAPSGQIWIRADVRAGRTGEQKLRLTRRIATAAAQIAGCTLDDLWVYLNELPPENMIEFGHVLPVPGHENEWLNGLSSPLRERLTGLEKKSPAGEA